MKIKTAFFFLSLSFTCFYTSTYAQVKIGSSPLTIHKDAVLHLESSNKGILFPKVVLLNTTSAAPLSAHIAGMIVYNTASNPPSGLYCNNGIQWVYLGSNLYVEDGSIPTNTMRNVSFGDNAKLNLDANTLVVDGLTNNIGIGTDAPAAPLHIKSDKAIILPVGTSEQRPYTPVQGMIRYNTTTNKYEGYNGTTWVDFN